MYTGLFANVNYGQCPRIQEKNPKTSETLTSLNSENQDQILNGLVTYYSSGNSYICCETNGNFYLLLHLGMYLLSDTVYP